MTDPESDPIGKPPMRLVTLLLQEIPHYRVAFLDRLRARLCTAEIELQVLYGSVSKDSAGRAVTLDRPWVHEVATIALHWFAIDIVWQSYGPRLRTSDLIVIEQSNRLLVNYFLQLRRRISRSYLAYWGHGRNLQAKNPDGLRERWKRSLLRAVDWWFAYSESTRDYVALHGFDRNRITIVNNSSDDCTLQKGLAESRQLPRERIRARLGCGNGPMALYCGTLHVNKRIEFLLATAQRLRAAIPEFEMLIVGDGPERYRVESVCSEQKWMHYYGAVFGEECGKYWYAADVALIPGPVGLVLVDSFVAECPLVTTQNRMHGPEISYLRSGGNGLISENSLDAYVAAALNLLVSRETIAELQNGCRESAQRFSLDAMVENFAGGVLACMSLQSHATDKNVALNRQATYRSQ